MSGIFHNWERN